MTLWIDRIVGHSEFDLQNINLLNHYIGMEPIIEASIPEFRYTPYILGFTIAGAMVAFFYPRRIMAYLGLINLVLIGAAGLYDFWRWEYNYGHRLDPDAPISIPGMSYQPPLLGCKNLLNITACSYPHIGGFILIGVGAILSAICLSEWLTSHRAHKKVMRGFLAALLFLSACVVSGPVDFKSGAYTCDYCKMSIIDMRFKSEILSPKGKVYRFDSIECMLAWARQHSNMVQARWVSDFFEPKRWISLEAAYLLRSDTLPSPMGAFLSAYATPAALNRVRAQYGGVRLSAEAAIRHVEQIMSETKPQAPSHK